MTAFVHAAHLHQPLGGVFRDFFLGSSFARRDAESFALVDHVFGFCLRLLDIDLPRRPVRLRIVSLNGSDPHFGGAVAVRLAGDNACELNGFPLLRRLLFNAAEFFRRLLFNAAELARHFALSVQNPL